MRSQSSAPTRALIDGEIVVEDENGVSDFSALQDALKHGKSDRFVYYVFDLLHLDGEDLRRAAADRAQGGARQSCCKGTDRNGIVRCSEHFEDDGAEMLRARLRA